MSVGRLLGFRIGALLLLKVPLSLHLGDSLGLFVGFVLRSLASLWRLCCFYFRWLVFLVSAFSGGLFFLLLGGFVAWFSASL